MGISTEALAVFAKVFSGMLSMSFQHLRRLLGRPRNQNRQHHRALEMLEPRQMLSAQPMITEIMASNRQTLEDGNGRSSDWIEIYNPTAEVVNVADWTIGDDEAEMVAIGDLVEDATVSAGGYLLVMTKVALEDGSEIGFGLKKDGSETLFVTMFTDGWSVEVPESLGEDLSYARVPNGEFTWENGVVASPGAAN